MITTLSLASSSCHWHPPQPAGTAVPSSFSWKMCLLLLFKQISSHLMWWQGSRVDSTSSHFLGCSPLSLLYIAGICKGLQLLLHVSESVISLHFRHSQASLKCGVPRPKTTADLFQCETPLVSLNPLMISCVPNISTNNRVYFRLAITFLTATAPHG